MLRSANRVAEIVNDIQRHIPAFPIRASGQLRHASSNHPVFATVDRADRCLRGRARR